MSDFDLQVIKDAYLSTGSTTWDDKVIDWFWRNDFIPANWQDDYLEYVRSL